MSTAKPALSILGDFVATASVRASGSCQRKVRNSIIDALGCIIAGARTPLSKSAMRSMSSLGTSEGGAWICGADFSAPAHTSALLNAISGHALEFDDWEIPGNTHPSAVMLPALLSVADERTTESDLVSAYVAGFEVIARLGEAFNFGHYESGWHSTATLGSLGAAAAVARLRKLSPDQTAHAFSIAVSRASGFTCQFGADTKVMQAGFAAESGVIAAALSSGGMTGRLDVLEHPSGMGALMGGVSPDRIYAVLAKLGQPLALEEYGIVLKPWPSCGYTHRIMGCARQLAAQLESTDNIAVIDLFLPDFHAAVLPFHQPQSRQEAMFSLPFAAAMGIMHGDLTLDHLDQALWKDPLISRLIKSTSVYSFEPARPALNYDPREPDRMKVTLTDGHQLESECAFPLGAPENPMTDKAVMDKFRKNAGVQQNGVTEAFPDWSVPHCVHSILESFSRNSEST